MSNTEVDGQPGGVAETHEPVAEPDEPAEVQGGGGAGRAALVVVPLVVGLVITAAVGARLLLAEVPDRTVPAPPVKVLCWDGETRLEKDCGTPSGRAGLRWMFPSFRPANLDCRNVLPDHPKSTRPAMFECRGRVSSGSVRIRYSQLTSVERGRAYYEKKYGGPPQRLDDALGRRLLWTEGDDPGNGVHELAVMYADLPFSVELRARSAAARDEALKKLVRFRPEEDAFVRPFG